MSSTRAFYARLRRDVQAAGRKAATESARYAAEHARETDGSGRHRGGWKDNTGTLSKSIRPYRNASRSTSGEHVVGVSALATSSSGRAYARDVERAGFWVVTGLGLRMRAGFRHLFRLHLRARRDAP